jgi:hypothetical protein
MSRPSLGIVLAVALTVTMATTASAGAVKDARYRVRHGGKAALKYFERTGTFERFNSRKAGVARRPLRWPASSRGTHTDAASR